jgi:prepilin-type N-terminal cleavage/methylation domain-containing protein
MYRSTRARSAFTLIELLVVIAIIAILIGLLMPAVQQVREAAARTTCINNLKQMGLALHSYHDVNGNLPSGYYPYGVGARYAAWSWMAFILPYIEQQNAYTQADAFAATDFYPWHNPVLGIPMKIYTCPNDPRGVLVVNNPAVTSVNGPIGLTMYLGNSGTSDDPFTPDGLLYISSKVHLTHITDGTSNTIMVGERPPSTDMNFGWWFAGYGWDGRGTADCVLPARAVGSAASGYFGSCPATNVGLRPGNVNNMCDAVHWWSNHPGGALFLMGDGSARFISYANANILAALQTRAGGEVVMLN